MQREKVNHFELEPLIIGYGHLGMINLTETTAVSDNVEQHIRLQLYQPNVVDQHQHIKRADDL